MKNALHIVPLIVICMASWLPQSAAQDKKLERIRIGGGAVGAPQMTMWFAKEASLYEKHGLGVEAIHIPGSSLALQAMLSGDVPIIQLGGTASMQANLAGADTVIVATILKKFLFSIFSRPDITRIADLKGSFSAPLVLARSPTSPPVSLWRKMASTPNGTSRWCRPAANQKPSSLSSPEKFKPPRSPCLQPCGPGKLICASYWIWPHWKRPSTRTAS